MLGIVVAAEHQFAEHPIPRTVFLKGLGQVTAEIAARSRHQQIVEIVDLLPGERGRRDQPLNRFRSLAAVLVRRERLHLGGGGDSACEVERHATQPLEIVRRRRGRDTNRRELRVDKVIDRVGDRAFRGESGGCGTGRRRAGGRSRWFGSAGVKRGRKDPGIGDQRRRQCQGDNTQADTAKHGNAHGLTGIQSETLRRGTATIPKDGSPLNSSPIEASLGGASLGGAGARQRQ